MSQIYCLGLSTYLAGTNFGLPAITGRDILLNKNQTSIPKEHHNVRANSERRGWLSSSIFDLRYALRCACNPCARTHWLCPVMAVTATELFLRPRRRQLPSAFGWLRRFLAPH